MDQPSSGGGYDPALEARVARLEEDVRDIKATLARLEPMIIRIDAILPHLATKAELAELRTEVKTDLAGLRAELTDFRGEVRAALADKPSRAYLWGVFTALIAAYAAGLAALEFLK